LRYRDPKRKVNGVIQTELVSIRWIKKRYAFSSIEVFSLKIRRIYIQMHLKQIHNENSRYCYDKIQREILLQKLIIAQINDLQQKILRASKGTKTPSQALCQAYTMLREEQKIAFLLAGGGEQLFWYQHQEQEQRGKTDQSSSDPRTDDLPVLC
jgi:23S rRNA pseudoU1915 N3-methylase RlmH